MNEQTDTRTAVSIEGDPDGDVFYAETISEHRWNGWARPYFGGDELTRVLEWNAAIYDECDGEQAPLFAFDSHGALWEHRTDDDEATAYRVPRNGDTFNVGDGWVWDEVLTDDDEN